MYNTCPSIFTTFFKISSFIANAETNLPNGTEFCEIVIEMRTVTSRTENTDNAMHVKLVWSKYCMYSLRRMLA